MNSMIDIRILFNRVFISYLLVLFSSIGLSALFFPQYIIPIDIFSLNVFFVLLDIAFLFYFVNNVVYEDWTIFYRKLFWGCVLYCFFYIVVEYLLSYYLTPESFPFWITGTDQFLYYKQGVNFSHALRGETDWTFLRSFDFDDRGFISWVGCLFFLIDEIHLPVKLLNSFLLGGTACILASVVEEQIGNSHGAKLAGVLYAFLPTMGFLSSVLLKEVTMFFFVACWLVCLVRTVKRKSIGYAFLFCVFILIMFTFRSFMGVLEIFLSFVYFSSQNKRMLLACMTLGLIAILMYGNTLLYNQEQVSSGYDKLQSQSFYQKNKSIEHTAKIGGLIALFPISPIMPIPTTLDSRSSFDVSRVASLCRIHQECIRIVLTFFFYLGLLYLFSNRDYFPMSLFAIGAITILFIDTYLGATTYYRYQSASLLFMTPVMVYGLLNFSKNINRNLFLFLLYDIVVIFIICIYNIYRIDVT